jgi:hypothetical protein
VGEEKAKEKCKNLSFDNMGKPCLTDVTIIDKRSTLSNDGSQLSG